MPNLGSMEKMVRFFLVFECLSYNSCFNRFLYYKIFALTLKHNILIFIFQCIFQNRLRFSIITVFFTKNIAVKKLAFLQASEAAALKCSIINTVRPGGLQIY